MTIPSSETDLLTRVVSRIFSVDAITWGTQDQNFLVRYDGQLIKDSVEAYDVISAALKPKKITPLFREEGGKQSIILVDGIIEPTPSNTRINLILFLLTLLSVALAGSYFAYEGDAATPTELYKDIIINISSGWIFAGSLLAIIVAHEFGHYLAARFHKTAVTLPYFIPLPLIGSFGTMGAFIQLKEPPKNKRVLHDIGIAGPLAGLIIAIPIVLIGLSLSPIEEVPAVIPAGKVSTFEGNSILYLLAKYVIHGEWLPIPLDYNGMAPIIYWARYLLTGFPLPLGSQDVILHPMAWAGWVGLLVTALNLIPAGQFDGGHILYVLMGKNARRLLPIILVTLSLLGLIWQGWWIWVFLIFFLGRQHAEPLDQITKLNAGRKTLAILGLIIFVLVFMPVPLRQVLGSTIGL